MLSVNRLAYKLVKKLEKNKEYYGITVKKIPSGALLWGDFVEADPKMEVFVLTKNNEHLL